MDKFDENIKAAQPEYELSGDLVNNVMSEIARRPSMQSEKRSTSLLGAAALVGLLFGGVSVLFFAQGKSQNQVASQGSSKPSHIPGSSSSPSTNSKQPSAKPPASQATELSKISTEIQAAIAVIDSELLASDLDINSLSLEELEQ